MGIEWLKPAAFIGSIVYALIGVVIFWLCFVLIDKITPTDLWAEIVEKQNRALALERLQAIVTEAAHVPEVRRATKPTYGSKQRRLEGKSIRAQVKAMRRKPDV